MPRGGRRPGTGGARPGAGRPRKHPKPDAPKPDVRSQAQEPPPAEAPAQGPSKQPLEYMLGVMNDTNADPRLRAQMAVAAAPYVHKKMGEGGKKEGQQERAKELASKFTPSTPPPAAVRKATH